MWYTMLRKKTNIFIKILLYLIIGILFFTIFKDILEIINVYYDVVYYIMIILYLMLGICLYFNKKEFLVIIYYFVIFIFLFLRKTEPGINFEFYLFDWLKNIFNNKIIFINIVGNIILFIPFGIINKNIIKVLVIILLVELLQLILRKGIFDIVDIILNMTGAIIGYIGVKIWMKITRNKPKKKK